MTDLTNRIISLSEYMIRNGVKGDTYHKGMELFLEHVESYKRKHGSVKHLQGDNYYHALKLRYNYAESKTKEYIISQMVKQK